LPVRYPYLYIQSGLLAMLPYEYWRNSNCCCCEQSLVDRRTVFSCLLQGHLLQTEITFWYMQSVFHVCAILSVRCMFKLHSTKNIHMFSSIQKNLVLTNSGTLTGLLGGGIQIQIPPQNFWSFEKAEPNSLFCGIYIHNNIIRIQISFICKLSGIPD
jgi:hypothetical protein